jgi:hypothetical protein
MIMLWPQTAVTTVVVAQLVCGVLQAQDGPDFTGRWTLVPELSVIQGADGPITVAVFGSDFSIHRESNTLLLRVAPDVAPTFRVNLDGTPTTHSKSGPDDRLVNTTVRATWEDESLVIQLAEEGVRNGQSFHGRTLRRLTLNPDHTLQVEMPDGEGGPMISSVYRWLEAMP